MKDAFARNGSGPHAAVSHCPRDDGRGQESWGAEELAATLDSVGTGVWALDLEGRCVFINQSACRILGYTPDECLGRKLQCLIHKNRPDGWVCEKHDCRVQCAIASGSAIHVNDDLFWRRDGTAFAVQYSVHPVSVQGRARGSVISVADITPQKRAEEALRKSDEWLRFAQNAAGVGIFDRDLQTGEARASEGQFQIFGLAPSGEWPSHEEWRKLVHPGDRERIDRQIEATLAGAAPAPEEYRVVWPDGSVHWLLAQRTAYFDEGGRAVRLIGANVDVTSRVRAEAALNQFFLQSPTPLAIWGFDGRIQKANAAWEPILGFTPAELEGVPVIDLVHPEDRAAAAAHFEELFVLRKSTGFECRGRCKDGSYRWFIVNARVVSDAQGIYVTAQDITTRKAAEEALRESEARFRSAFDNTLFGMAISTPDGRYLQVNQSFCRMTGFTGQELLQTGFVAITHPDDVPENLEHLRALLDGSAPGVTITKRYIRKDGEQVWAAAHVSAVRDGHGMPLYLVSLVEDLTARKRAEEALRQSEEWLRFAQGAAGVGFFERDFKSGLTRVSDQQFLLYGLVPRTRFPVGADLLQMVHPDDRERLVRELDQAKSGETSYETQYRVVWPDGTVHWLNSHGRVFCGETGEPERFVGANVDITERVRAESTAREFFDLSPAPLAICAFDGCIRRANRSLVNISGFTLEDLRERPASDLFHPEDRAALTGAFRKVAATGETAALEARGLAGNGSIRWFLLTLAAVHDEDLIYVAAYDITERKAAESALAGEALRRRTVFEQSRDGIVIFDPGGNVCQSNQSFAAMLGYSLEEMLQLHVWDWDAHLTRDQILELMRNSKSLPATFETRHKRKDGSLLDVEISSICVESGDDVFHYAVTRDISARKRMEESLCRSERRFKLIAETIDEVFWINDAERRKILYLSPAYERVWGRPRERVYEDPESFLAAIHPDDSARVSAAAAVLHSGLRSEIEYQIVRPDGTVASIWDRAFPVRDATGKLECYVGIAQDITERKRMEEELRTHSENLARSNAELERFAYVASHDLQEPLRMVASFTQLLSKRYTGKLDETADLYIHYAVDGAKRMQQLIADLLEYSRVNSKELELRPTPCEDVVEVTLQNLRAAIEESGAVVACDRLPVLMADAVQLGQVFQNLIGNAIKFRGQAPPLVRIAAEDKGAHWLFCVVDNGIGIDPRHADRVFQIFQRLHARKEYPGTGIGLAVCKKVVERHGGKIWVESQAGAGSEFRFTLPKPERDGVDNGRTQQTRRDSPDRG